MSFANKRNLGNEDNMNKNPVLFRNKKTAMNIKPIMTSKQNESTIAKEFVKQPQRKMIKLSDSKAKPFSQKEEIQKRLNLLKQNTLQIVSRNVQNSKRMKQIKVPNSVSQMQMKNTPNTSENKKHDNIIVTPSVTNSVLINSNEKIGILRQTDDSTSPSNNLESLSTSLQTTFSEKLSELINIENEYQLKVPETRLRTPIKEYIKNDERNTPFWLKPSSLQTYPYNFIMAVRKKLESLSHPIQGPLQKTNYNDYADKSKIRLKCSESIPKKISISDANTNFSSISLNVQDSNTISDVSSIKSESIRNVQHVDSNSDSSGEKNMHSPLFVDKINNLRIQSDIIEFEDRKVYTNEKDEQQNLQKIFEAFNKKLSQCIEVNKQLYSSLHNPQRAQDKHKPKYTEDFDNEADLNSKSNPLNEKTSQDDSFLMRGNWPLNANFENSLIDLENKENSRSLMGHDILSVFNQFDLNNTVNTSAISESNLSYSNLGMYDQLIQSETSKSEHLTSITMKREKYLIDWTKGQISWLELQRQKCKENGELSKIKGIKKKQRALLLKLENRKSQNELIKTQERPQKTFKMVPFDVDSSRISTKLTKKNKILSCNTGALKVFEPNHSNVHLERILRNRETELEKRREQVQNFIEWHQRLDNEEDELILMEKGLEKYNLHKNVLPAEVYSNKTTTDNIVDVTNLIVKDQKRFNKIENSLNVLLNIAPVKSNDHFVEASGIKMNRLWKKLTGKNDLKFDQKINYKLSKTDLENLYEDAKSFVVQEFCDHKHLKTLLENSETRSDSDVTLKSVKMQISKGESLDSNKSIQYSSDFVSNKNDLVASQSEKVELKETSDQSEESNDKNIDSHISQELHIIEIEEDLPQQIANDREELKISDLEIATNEISEVLDEILENNSFISTIAEITSLSNYSDTHNPSEDDKNEDQSNNFTEQDQNTTSNEESLEHISETIQESVDLEKRLISLDDCLKDLNTTFDVLNSQENSSEIKSTDNIRTDLAGSSSSGSTFLNSDEKVLDTLRLEVNIKNKNTIETVSVNKDLVAFVEYKCLSLKAGMPDIINEAEVLRRQQLQIEQEIQRLEQLHQAPTAVFLREIPNKPPPPYVYPHTTICPEETKIVNIVETEIKSLYENTEHNSLETTNIYERILSDVCKEVYDEFNSALKHTNLNYLNKLSLYNPPDFLKAMQSNILEKVKQLLLFDEKKLDGQNKRWWWAPSITGGKKRDLVDEILIREMFENNSNWTNFDLEELEVKNNIFNDVKKLMFAETEQ